jgi:hypothetical protein
MQYQISDAIDCLRVKYRTTYEGDTTSYIVEKADIISAIFPPMEDVPFRKIKKAQGGTSWQLTSLISAFEDDSQDKFYSLQVPYEFDIDVGDMIFRIFLDEAQKFPIILALTVTELLGTFGHHMIIMQKCKSVIPTDSIPQEIVDCIQDMAVRRLKIRY